MLTDPHHQLNPEGCYPPGWEAIVQRLAFHLDALPERLEVVQVKEKFGGLRFYVAGDLTDQAIRRIENAERRSRYVCETCGRRGTAREVRGWLRTLCERCV